MEWIYPYLWVTVVLDETHYCKNPKVPCISQVHLHGIYAQSQRPICFSWHHQLNWPFNILNRHFDQFLADILISGNLCTHRSQLLISIFFPQLDIIKTHLLSVFSAFVSEFGFTICCTVALKNTTTSKYTDSHISLFFFRRCYSRILFHSITFYFNLIHFFL